MGKQGSLAYSPRVGVDAQITLQDYTKVALQ